MEGEVNGFPLFFEEMKIALFAILFLLTSCGMYRRTDSAERHADTLSRLHSRSVNSIDREITWERIVMRPDTATGELRVVSHDVIRHTDKGETVQADSTARETTASTKSETEKTEETTTATTATKQRSFWDVIVAGLIWTLCIGGVLLLAKYLLKTWTLRL